MCCRRPRRWLGEGEPLTACDRLKWLAEPAIQPVALPSQTWLAEVGVAETIRRLSRIALIHRPRRMVHPLAGNPTALSRHRFSLKGCDVFGSLAISQRDPWLCAPISRWVCLYRNHSRGSGRSKASPGDGFVSLLLQQGLCCRRTRRWLGEGEPLTTCDRMLQPIQLVNLLPRHQNPSSRNFKCGGYSPDFLGFIPISLPTQDLWIADCERRVT